MGENNSKVLKTNCNCTTALKILITYNTFKRQKSIAWISDFWELMCLQVRGSLALQWASHWWLHTLCGTVRWLAMTRLTTTNKRTKTLERESERDGEERESGLLFAPHFLLAFCFILSRMTSAAHPRSVSFHLPSALSLHFKLVLVFSSVCQISPHDGIICSARCALMHTTLLSITHRPITPMTD